MTSHGVDFMMPPERPAKRTRAAAPEVVSREDLAAVEAWFDDGATNSQQLAASITRVVAAGVAVMKSGLTMNALCLLLQDQLPKKSGGGSHGKPLVDLKTIAAVLTAIPLLEQHLTAPLPKAWKK